jgi:hypothetical protein
MSWRDSIVYMVVGLALGYIFGSHMGGSPVVCPAPIIQKVLVPVQGAPKECPPCECPVCPSCLASPELTQEIPETTQPPEEEDIHLVPDSFPTPATGPITNDPAPILDHNSDIIRYHDHHIHNYGKMPSPARKQNVWLVVYVPTAVGFGSDQQQNVMVANSVKEKGQPSERRAVIRTNFRKSWLYKNGQAKLWFVLSSQSPLLKNAAYKARVDAEAQEFGDLFFANCPDVDNDFDPPSGTTIKMGYAFQHAAVHYNYNYFSRGSDDVHFNVDQLYRLIVIHRAVPSKRVFMGKRWINMGVRTPAQAKRFGAHYPAYPQGLGYVMSADIAVRLGKMVQMGVPFLTDWPEDAIVSSWVTGWGINIVDSLRWFHNKMGSGGPEFACAWDSIMTHDLSPAQLRSVDDSGVWKC